MHLIVGLGNPGKEYKDTRHNAGFWVVDALVKKSSAQFKRRKDYFWCKSALQKKPVVIAKPRTFVNLSGNAVKKIAKDFEIDNEKIIIIHDDADLPLGTLKIKKGGSSAGHNGVQSIIDSLGSSDFQRVRIGIGRSGGDLKDYVLSEFSNTEKKIIKETIKVSLSAILTLVVKGIDEAMLQFNKRIKERSFKI